jgi:hypothetical protein
LAKGSDLPPAADLGEPRQEHAVTRQEALRSLVLFDRTLDLMREDVSRFPYDWDGPPLAILGRHHLLAVLARWQSGELSAPEVEAWADLIDTRNDVDHDPADPSVTVALFDLANPMLQGDLARVAPKLIKALTA